MGKKFASVEIKAIPIPGTRIGDVTFIIALILPGLLYLALGPTVGHGAWKSTLDDLIALP